ncbi:MAG: hypothetical protein RLZZ532_3990 [Cyanobacteriota bacterium]
MLAILPNKRNKRNERSDRSFKKGDRSTPNKINIRISNIPNITIRPLKPRESNITIRPLKPREFLPLRRPQKTTHHR